MEAKGAGVNGHITQKSSSQSKGSRGPNETITISRKKENDGRICAKMSSKD